MKTLKAKTVYNIGIDEDPYVKETPYVPESGSDIINSFSNEDEAIDLSAYTIGNLYNVLESAINSQTPLFIWSRERQNKKIELNNEKQALILGKIAELRKISDQFNRLKADAIFSAEYVRNLIANNRMQAEHYFEQAVAKHEKEITDSRVDTKLKKSQLAHDQLALEEKSADIRIKIAIAVQEEQKGEEKKIKNKLVKNITDSIDYNNLPVYYKSLILTHILDADIEKLKNFDIDQELNKIRVKEAQAEANIKEAAAESANLDNDNKRESYKRNKDKKP